MTTNLEGLIAEVNSLGLKVNNLFQSGDNWQANLTDGAMFWEYGHGSTAREALQEALSKFQLNKLVAPPKTHQPSKGRKGAQERHPSTLTLDDLDL